MTEPVSGRRIKTTDRVFDIVEFIKRHDRPTLTAIANDLELSKSTTSLHLSTLVDLEYLVREGDTYRLSLQFLDIGEHVRQGFILTDVMEPALQHVAEDTAEVTVVTIEEHGWAVTIGIDRGPRGVQTFDRIGTRTYLHAHGPGKAILSTMNDEEIEAIIDRRGLPAFTDKTITDSDRLLDNIQVARDQGFALDRGEGVEGLRSVAAPILCDGERGAIGVAGPLNRMKGDKFRKELPEVILGAANEIELKCQHH